MLSPDEEILLDRELGSKSLRHFVRMCWPQIEPARPYQHNWHHDAFSDHLEAVTRHEILRLVINVPPGTTKSVYCSVLWPVWTWTQIPTATNPGAATRWITASYSDRVARRDARRSMQLMESQWFRDRWGYLWEPNRKAWSPLECRNNLGGLRYATTVGGSAVGEHAHNQLVDDPLKPLEASGDRVDSAALATVREWWDETMTSRVLDPATTARVIIMQRLHDADLAGHAMMSGDYVHLNLPMEYERRCVITVPHMCSLDETDRGITLPPTPIGFKDPRQKDGDLLWPEHYPASVLPQRKKEMGARGVAAQDQQRPQPAGGSIFKRDWIQFYRVPPADPMMRFVQSWDCAFKGLLDSDYVVGQVWARRGGEFFLLDQIRDQMAFSATCKAIATLSMKWKRATRKLVEDKANGPAVIDVMGKKVPGLLPVDPRGGKIARAHAVEPLWESGNVWLPDPEIAPWIHDFVEEVIGFTGDPGKKDDQVDAMTQALSHLYSDSLSSYVASLQRVHLGF